MISFRQDTGLVKNGKGVLNQMEKSNGNRNPKTGYNFVRRLWLVVFCWYNYVAISLNGGECCSWFNGIYRE